MKLTFHGGAQVVTGACYLLETKEAKILVDCGLFQGKREWRQLNYEDFPFDPAEIDFVLLTHSHMDHIGRVPKLVKDGFKGKIITTNPSRDFSHLFLLDSAHLQEEEAREVRRDPLYGEADVEASMKFFQGVDYGGKIELTPNVKCRFTDAGHILGSAIIEIWAGGKKIVFTGDLGNPPVPLLKATELVDKADYVIIESAYGNRNHETFEERKNILEDAIEEVVANKGVLMIPAFAMERTQEVLYELNELVEKSRVPKIPIFVDSPLAIKATAVYRRYENYFNQEATHLIDSGDDIFKFPGLEMTVSGQESRKINNIPKPKIIIAGSGMSTGGRILFHEKLYLPDPNNKLLIVGYQVKGTLGRRLLEGEKEVMIKNEKVSVKAKIQAVGGYSAHADQQKLVHWLDHLKKPVQQVFVVQGEDGPAHALAQKVNDELGMKATVPKLGEEVEL
ncbi:MAG: MBL fold metallo-hydrolase [Parcubacteria group bacterium]|nr:MBL fold metallo-hydrolase [Parcubacteria group bacterium]